MLSERAQQILRSKAMGHLAVVDEHGRPHVTPLWVDVEQDGTLWFNTAVGRIKDRHLPIGAHLALSATDLDNPYEYVQVRGTVVDRRLENGDSDIDRLAKKYLDADAYPFRKEGEQRVTIIVEPYATTGV